MATDARTPAHAADARTDEPRPASERLLRALSAWLDGPASTAVVAAAPGAGTTFLLRSFERRARAHRPVLFTPFLHVEPEALEHWLAGLVLASTGGSLDAWLAGAPDAPALLLVDEAQTAPLATLEALVRLRETRAPKLRICIGGCAGPALERAARTLGGADAVVLELPPWSAEDLGGFAEALCLLPVPHDERVASIDAAALVAAADGSPRMLRDAWTLLRDGRAPLPRAVALSLPAPEVPAPSSLLNPGAPAAAPPGRRRVPWFLVAALGFGFSIGFAGGWQGWRDRIPPAESPPQGAALPAVAAAPPAETAPALHDVQVNARPWAWIRIDGRPLGVTPLVLRDLAEGEYEFEATFPDGRQQRRTVEIRPESRFVSFPE